jgi:hypothetical protein
MQDKPLELPPGYVFDASDPDLAFLRRPDGSLVAAFSARSADPTEVRRAAEGDQRNLAAWDERLSNVLSNARGAARLRPSQRRTPHRH